MLQPRGSFFSVMGELIFVFFPCIIHKLAWPECWIAKVGHLSPWGSSGGVCSVLLTAVGLFVVTRKVPNWFFFSTLAFQTLGCVIFEISSIGYNLPDFLASHILSQLGHWILPLSSWDSPKHTEPSHSHSCLADNAISQVTQPLQRTGAGLIDFL